MGITQAYQMNHCIRVLVERVGVNVFMVYHIYVHFAIMLMINNSLYFSSCASCSLCLFDVCLHSHVIRRIMEGSSPTPSKCCFLSFYHDQKPFRWVGVIP